MGLSRITTHAGKDDRDTTCYEVRDANNALLILDAGTGIRELGLSLLSEQPIKPSLLISHTHWDHIMGYPFFVPLFIPGNQLNIYGPPHFDHSFEYVMCKQMDYSFFPVRMEELAAALTFHDMKEGQYDVGGFKITARYMNHPVLCLGYRIEVDGKVFVYTGDTEPYYDTVFGDREPEDEEEQIEKQELLEHIDSQNAAMVEFLRDADLVIYDGTYTEEEYAQKRGWGHSSMEYCIRVCVEANVKKLLMTHHESTRTNDALDELQAKFRADLASQGASLDAGFAVEGETVDLGLADMPSSFQLATAAPQ